MQLDDHGWEWRRAGGSGLGTLHHIFLYKYWANRAVHRLMNTCACFVYFVWYPWRPKGTAAILTHCGCIYILRDTHTHPSWPMTMGNASFKWFGKQCFHRERSLPAGFCAQSYGRAEKTKAISSPSWKFPFPKSGLQV